MYSVITLNLHIYEFLLPIKTEKCIIFVIFLFFSFFVL